MITVTSPIRYSNHDFDEQQYLLSDLQDNPSDYLRHPDGFVRSLADWTLEYYKLRNLRPTVTTDAEAGRTYKRKLYQRLQWLTHHAPQPSPLRGGAPLPHFCP